VKKYGLQNRPSVKTPMLTDELVPFDSKATDHQIYAYQSKVGSVTYPACITRPDIARVTQKLAKFLTNPSPIHKQAVDRVICYLNSTRFLAIEYNGNNNVARLFYSAGDALFADCSLTRRSTGGVLHFLFRGPSDWRCFKQSTVSTSTTEAELITLAILVKMLLWWKRLFSSIELKVDDDQYVALCDNLQTVRLITSEAPKLETKLKHVDIS